MEGTHRRLSLRVERWNSVEAPNARELRERLEDEGYRVFEWIDAPGTVYDLHVHAEDQSHWIISGELELSIGDEQYTLRAGDRDYLPAYTRHTAAVRGDEAVIYLIGAKK
jgi:mannose-6-phosphate isomerase-like protein (cupin superfamily)